MFLMADDSLCLGDDNDRWTNDDARWCDVKVGVYAGSIGRSCAISSAGLCLTLNRRTLCSSVICSSDSAADRTDGASHLGTFLAANHASHHCAADSAADDATWRNRYGMAGRR
jgi:hypothetical protein